MKQVSRWKWGNRLTMILHAGKYKTRWSKQFLKMSCFKCEKKCVLRFHFSKVVKLPHRSTSFNIECCKKRKIFLYEKSASNIFMKESEKIATKKLSNSSGNIHLFQVNNRNFRKRCKKCSKLTTKTPERDWCRCGIFSFEHISHLSVLLLLLTWNK